MRLFFIQGVEKLITSKMMLPGSNRRIHAVHRHSGMVLLSLIFSRSLLWIQVSCNKGLDVLSFYSVMVVD